MVYTVFLIIHVAAGFSALALGMVAIITKKGGKNHLNSGKWYVWCMYMVALSAFVLASIKSNAFLFAVGVFTLYLTYSGQRAIFYFRIKSPYQLQWYDIAPLVIAFITSLAMIGVPAWDMLTSGQYYVSVIGVFGAILLLFSTRDIFTFRNPANFLPKTRMWLLRHPKTRMWLLRHIGQICGAYIATSTAFLVTNISFSPEWVVWLAPTLIGSILIARSIRQWKKKLKLV